MAVISGFTVSNFIFLWVVFVLHNIKISKQIVDVSMCVYPHELNSKEYLLSCKVGKIIKKCLFC